MKVDEKDLLAYIVKNYEFPADCRNKECGCECWEYCKRNFVSVDSCRYVLGRYLEKKIYKENN